MTQRIEALALQTPPLSVAAIHRQVVTLAAAHGTPAPCYRTVYNIIRRIAPALRTLAHDGSRKRKRNLGPETRKLCSDLKIEWALGEGEYFPFYGSALAI